VSRHEGIARLSIALDRPVVGLGASASLHYAELPALVGTECLVHEHADVANALGAVVGQVRMSATARVSQPEPGLYRVNSGEALDDYDSEAEAMDAAEMHVRRMSIDLAERAGADLPRIEIARDVDVAEIDGERSFIEARLVATATGRPRIAS
jgi:N-methylhydantoinase A/oxoprolinase/acetone carboxylase beta subunit